MAYYDDYGYGYGRGMGRGRGFGRGMGRGFGYRAGFGRGYGRGFGYGAEYYDYYRPSVEEEKAMLLDYKRYLEEELHFVEERLRDIDKYSQGGDR
ncbi:DUF5320 family protein [Marinitoga aeolica]|uniref:DUF5320 family protein n=1 Tax=Marinitoga aeolica TaxID=2809031 RepID=A0ABY8PSR7_9BACT|nr:DUF5320 family protein [Marinitoga aeolica]WGS65668.1 DUF5320 family protein [Marinitoga aeolica]